MNKILDLIDKQAEDEGIWFRAEYITEAYLQKELRELHRVCEDYFKEEK